MLQIERVVNNILRAAALATHLQTASYIRTREGTNTLTQLELDLSTGEQGQMRPELESSHEASFAWALSCCGYDYGEAEEVLQTVYLKILEGKAVWNQTAALQTWLFSVIRNTAASRRRWKFIRDFRLVPLEQGARSANNPVADLEKLAEQNERSTRVHRALSAIASRQREVLHLVFFEGLTVHDAAVVMGVSIGSARQHYDRAKKRLRQLMEAV